MARQYHNGLLEGLRGSRGASLKLDGNSIRNIANSGPRHPIGRDDIATGIAGRDYILSLRQRLGCAIIINVSDNGS